MRIISCASYYGSGSSAITDLLSEYSNVKSMTNKEFRFIQDPNGISDLEYNLVENHHRHNSGYALKKYKKLVDFLAGNKIIKKYEPYFNYKWKDISYEYIRNLTLFESKSYWHYDVIDKGRYFYLVTRILDKLLKKTIWRNDNDKGLVILPNEVTLYSQPSEKEFLDLTKHYIFDLFKAANDENKSEIIVDQLVPPSNLNRYIRYFDKVKVFVVDRDPRDIYLLTKYVWKSKTIPIETPEVFCQWYKYTRKHREYDDPNENVMFLYFEDLIYNYEKTVEEIEHWLGFDAIDHVDKFKKLDPQKSINNTRLWMSNDFPREEIKIIEDNLHNYLYGGSL